MNTTALITLTVIIEIGLLLYTARLIRARADKPDEDDAP